MITFLVKKPIGVLVSFFALLLLGIVAYVKTPISLLPKIDIPVIIVQISGNQLSSQETEKRVSTPLRNALGHLSGLKEIESKTTDGKSTIRLTFNHSVDISLAFFEVNEKIDMTMNNLPRDVSRPLVVKTNVSDIPAFRLNISQRSPIKDSDDFATLSRFSREIVRRRIEQIPYVSMVDITGVEMPEIEVVPKQGILESLNVDNDELIKLFNENNYNLGAILVKDGHYRYYVRFANRIENLEDVKQLPLNINGRLLKLSDIASIRPSNGTTHGFYLANGGPAINFAIIKHSDSRMGNLKKAFNTLVEQMEKDYPGVKFEITQDQTEILDSSIENLQQDLIFGGTLAFIFIIIFIRQWRLAVLIGIAIPLSLILSQLGFFLFDISINIISLGGLVLGLSMIIDNSIVVVDTIRSFHNNGVSAIASAERGVNEIFRPIITSVLTNCAVFIPLIFLSDLAGTIFLEQAISIVIGVLSSFLIAILLLPVLYVMMYKNKHSDHSSFNVKAAPIFSVQYYYDKLLRVFFRKPYLALMLVGIIICTAIWCFSNIDNSRLPSVTKSDFEVFVDWNEYLNPATTHERLVELSNTFLPYSKTINIWSGPQQYLLPMLENMGYTQSRIYFQINRPYSLTTFQEKVSSFIASNYPEASISIQPAKNVFDEVFAEQLAPLTIQISDSNQGNIPEVGIIEQIISELKKSIPDARINPISLYSKINISIDQELTTRYNVSEEIIVKRISHVLKAQKVGELTETTSPIPLVIGNKQSETINDMLSKTFIVTSEEEEVPLSRFVNIERVLDYKDISAGIFGQYYPLDIFTNHPEASLEQAETILSEYQGDINYVFKGGFFNNKKLVEEMIFVFCISVLLLYLILAAQFESLIQPLFILIELPIATCGAIILLKIGNNSLNIMSMIGIVVMSGIIINDSILKIDAINQLRRKGAPLLRAIYKGGHKRIQPIVMISLTGIGTLLPTLFMTDLGSELQQSLVLAMIGGLVVGLFVSLFFVPIIYWLAYNKK